MNASVLDLDFVSKAIENVAKDEKCSQLHQHSCNYKAAMQGLHGSKSMLGVYFVVHLLPLLLKFKKTTKEPGQSLKKFLKGYIKSVLFVFGTMFMVRRGICFFTNNFQYSSWNAVVTGWLCGPMLILEPTGRQIEVSLFAFNKCMEMVYLMARRRYRNLWVSHGEKYLNALAMAILCYYFIQNASLFRPHYQNSLNLLLKDV